MYPASYFGLFPAFPIDDRAFVAMSFDPKFDARWNNVIAPAVREVKVNGRPLEPHRVDMRRVSDSILTEILDGIARCRVFIADISSIGELGDRAVRNANVMYEVGLAHATRLPEEVVLLRSDDRELLFDVANIRVHRYHPDDSPETARRFLTETIVSSLREVDLRKNLAVRRAADSLDGSGWTVLLEASADDVIGHRSTKTVFQVLEGIGRAQAIARLLEMGAMQAELVRLMPEDLSRMNETQTEELVKYRITPLGSALAEYAITQLGMFSEDLRPAVEKMLAEMTEEGEPA